MISTSRGLVSATAKLQSGEPVQAMLAARIRLTSSGKPIACELVDGLRERAAGHVGEDEVLLPREPDLASQPFSEVGDAEQLASPGPAPGTGKPI